MLLYHLEIEFENVGHVFSGKIGGEVGYTATVKSFTQNSSVSYPPGKFFRIPQPQTLQTFRGGYKKHNYGKQQFVVLTNYWVGKSYLLKITN